MLSGQIVKSTGGLYLVKTAEGDYNCRPRGIFRKEKKIPYVGDFVKVEPTEERSGTIVEIDTRKNSLIRPPVANLDFMVIVVSTTQPEPNFVIIDKFLATMEAHRIKTVIAITKPDLGDTERIKEIYSKTGYSVFVINNETGEGAEKLENKLGSALSAFAGNTGTGKSSLLNALEPTLNLEVGEISKKLGRGRHTTRHVEIFQLANGMRVADTPGFSSMDIIETTDVSSEDLDSCFVDFEKFIPLCKFNDCRHLSETNCGVKGAVESGKIEKSRYSSYIQIYEEIKDVKEWERR